MRIAVIATNDPRNYGGGRYHGLMLAYAAAAAGMEVHVCTDRAPAFIRDLAPLCPVPPTIHQTHDFRSGMPGGKFDYVFLIPTGIFLPGFYEAALAFARDSSARLGLINFESGNWFNTASPTRRDPRIWDYWRRVCQQGGLVLSSARVSDAAARTFYRSVKRPLRFEVWGPPVNTVAAREADSVAKDGSLVTFIRPGDDHKGADGLLELGRNLLKGRKLVLISGTPLDAAFQERVAQMVSTAAGATLQVFTQIPDRTKFQLLAAAQALLFPSRFEGYGYPPLEAAFAGTEVVCNDLPVLRETVGAIAHFAPSAGAVGFNGALAAAFDRPSRPAELRAAVFRRADFGEASKRLVEILFRSAESVEALAPVMFRSSWGPWPGTALERIAPGIALPAAPPLVPEIISATQRGANACLTVRICAPGIAAKAEVRIGGNTVPCVPQATSQTIDGWLVHIVHLAVPLTLLGQVATLALLTADGQRLAGAEFQLEAAQDDAPRQPILVRLSEDHRDHGVRRLRGYVLSDPAATHLLLDLGGGVYREIPVDQERLDLAQKFPAYPSHRCQFVVALPAETVLGPDTRAFVVAGQGLVDVLPGWPPYAAAPPAAIAAPASPPAPTPASFSIDPVTNDYWLNGVGRTGKDDRQGAMALVREGNDALLPGKGGLVQVATGRVLRVIATEIKHRTVNLYFARPLNPLTEGAPNRIVVLPAAEASAASTSQIDIIPKSDDFWFNGIWNVRDRRHQTGILVRTTPGTRQITPGTSISVQSGGRRLVVAVESLGDTSRIWLNRRIGPLLDGPPHPVLAHASPGRAAETSFELLQNGLDVPFGTGGRRVRLRRLSGHGAVSRGAALHFPDSGIRRVLSVQESGSHLDILLDLSLSPGESGAAALLDGSKVADGVASTLMFGAPSFPARDPAHLRFALDALHDGRAVPLATEPAKRARERILFVTPVPPTPTNQGNRTVTRNLLEHLVAIGFDVDVVLQGHSEVFEAAAAFGDRVRILQTGFPDWAKAPGSTLRKELQQRIAGVPAAKVEQAPLEQMARAARIYHPFFIVRDETVELARALFTSQPYSAIVCNYTHMVRVAKELEAVGPLPPVAVITHDMLSRLPASFAGKPIDTLYRYCSPALEREALDAVDGAVVVAISESERGYLGEIGVSNRVVLAEYAGIEEIGRNGLNPGSFDRCTIVYHASANPMNVAGLNWFIDECWQDVAARVPQARLLIAGRITEVWKHQLPGLTLVGELSRADLIQLLREATIAINPCVVGTGLKIKTVEAACLGLPTVCLPDAVDGLEAVASELGIVAYDAAGFIEGCTRLLSDREAWSDQASRARALALERFHQTAVYRDLDEAMGWANGAEQRRMTPNERNPPDALLAPGAELLPAGGGDYLARLATNPDDTDAVLMLGYKLATIGQSEVGHSMIEKALLRRPGDPHAAAMASRTALSCGHGWLAAMHAAVVIAQRPAEAEGYRLMAQGLHACGHAERAQEAILQALAVAPFDPAVRATFTAIAGTRFGPALGRIDGPTLVMAPGERRNFTFNEIGYDPPGVGWSPPEDWGTWTEGAYARLRIEVPKPLPALSFKMAVLPRQHPDGAAQRFALLVDGEPVGEWLLDGSGATQVIAAHWSPKPQRPVSSVELRFLIADPAAFMVERKLVDPRRLGIAVLWLTVDEHATLVTAEELLAFDGSAFVTESYQQLLRKDADPDGMAHYLSELARGVPKIEIVRHLAREPDALAAGIRLVEFDAAAG